MNAIQELRMEHDAVKLTLKVLDRICQGNINWGVNACGK